ncbi:MAG: hypothetical protein KJZ80_09085 [Hyphomicrobiaceae bacterium]|nr:hypothetical protein [Hyphomicrobiaceae bacterium]
MARVVPRCAGRRLARGSLAAFLLGSLLAGCSASPDLESDLAEPARDAPVAEAAADLSAIAPIRAFVLRHAPMKQVEPRAGTPNPKIGKAPGSACEVIRFLTVVARADRTDTELPSKIMALADWVIGLQNAREDSPGFGGVPSTPDLPAPASGYFYTIDAGFCGGAMFALWDLTKEERYRRSGLLFADFLVRMQSGPGRPYARPADEPDGFCEFVVGAGSAPAWNCDRHVKSLSALPVLRRAAVLSGDPRYEAAAKAARAFLVPGLAGAWEHADAEALVGCRQQECPRVWRRVQGPQGQPDYFVYGDTLAYALRGLFEYEGASPTVRALYETFAGYRGKADKTRRYDGRIAFAGYMHPASASPDPFSAYYDLVTLGILHSLRRAMRPDHYALADAVLRSRLASAAQLSWKMEFDLGIPSAEFVDLTTLANLGEALALPAAPAAYGRVPPAAQAYWPPLASTPALLPGK